MHEKERKKKKKKRKRKETFGVNLTSNLQSLRVGDINVGGGDGQNNRVGVPGVLDHNLLDELLDVGGLVSNRDLSQKEKKKKKGKKKGKEKVMAPLLEEQKESRTRSKYLGDAGKVHEGEVEDLGGENPETNGLAADSLVRPRDPVGFLLNLGPDLVKVGEHLLGNVGELGPLGALIGSPGGAGDIVELEDQRPPGDDVVASREEVAPHDVLQHRGLACRLASHHNQLGEINGGETQGVEHILKLVDGRNQLVHDSFFSCFFFWLDVRRG